MTHRSSQQRGPRALIGGFRLGLVAASIGGLVLTGCERENAIDREAQEQPSLGAQPIEPLPQTVAIDSARAALGEELFKEPRLSGDAQVACSSCHLERHGLADERPHSLVPARPETLLNSPTMYNVRFAYKLGWSGKHDTLEAHLDALMKNPQVMASSWQGAAQRLAQTPGYNQRFKAVFRDGLTALNVRAALLEYERSLVTPNAPFDRFLRGDAQAISAQARLGYGLFKSYGCASCHQGMTVGGNVFERFGVLRDFFADRGHSSPADWGRFNVTGREQDRFVFRVPSLRNVALTAPYFHDGSAATLDEAVMTMARYQLGRELVASDVLALTAFLRSLTGEYRGKAP
jgi:cytochrome c peroxidase